MIDIDEEMKKPLQEANPGSPGGKKDSLVTRFLRWLYPDQRRAGRHDVPQVISYLGTKGGSLAYKVGDISRAGFYMLTVERWAPGCELLVTLQRSDVDEKDDRHFLTMTAKVARWGPDGIGFAFVLEGDSVEDGAQETQFVTRQAVDRFLQGLIDDSGSPVAVERNHYR